MFLSRLDSTEKWFQALETTALHRTAVRNLDPGQVSAAEPDEFGVGDQVFLVLEGEIYAEFAEEKARMLPGHALVIPAGVPHRFRNPGPAPARTMSVYAPSLGGSRMH